MPVLPSGVWVPDLFGDQWTAFNSNDRALLLSGSRLAAKCVDASTLIHCDGRMRRIGSIIQDLEQGEVRSCSSAVTSLIESKSQFQQAKINAVLRNPHTFGLEITTSGGYSINASPWHPIWCLVDGEFAFKTSTEIKALAEMGRLVWLPLKKGCDDWSHTELATITFPCANKIKKAKAEVHDRIASVIEAGLETRISHIANAAKTSTRVVREFQKQRRHVEQYKVTLNESLAYFLGVLVGDGCMTNACMAKFRILFATADYEIVNSMTQCLKEHFPKHRLHCVQGYNWQITSPMVNALIWHLKMNKYAHEKTIPECVIQSPKSVVRAFLQGLFDTDGTVGRGGYASYCSTSKSLAKDVQQLLLAFGITSSCLFKKNSHRGAWLVGIYGENARIFFNTVGFRLLRKQAGGAAIKRGKAPEYPMAYPPDVRSEIKRVYLSRHSRGAPRGDMPRIKKSKGWSHLYGSNGSSVSPDKLAKVIKFSFSQDDPVLNRYFIGGKVFWEPVVKTEICEVDLYDLSVPVNHNFIGNGFINHNSWASLHRIVRHLWDTPDARVGMFTKVLKNSKDAGMWKNLHNYTLKEWIAGNFGLHYTTKDYDGKPGPKVDGTTRTPFFRVTNRFGGESECMLFSLDNDNEAEEKLKEREFSMLYFSELSNFSARSVLSLGLLSLRMPHLDFSQQMWLADTNPSDEGETSWIYEAWYIERLLDYPEYAERQRKLSRPVMKEEAFFQFKKNLRLIEMFAKDNIRLKPGQLQELEYTYAYDPGLYARFVDGKWVYGDGDESLHFRRFYKKNVHNIGSCEGPDEDNWEKAVPSANCAELITGWDTGDVNHACAIIEKTHRPVWVPRIKQVVQRACFTILDEVVSLKTPLPLDEFTTEVLEIIEELEEYTKRALVTERAYSDMSALTDYSSTADTFPAVTIKTASFNRIILIGVPKPKYSVRVRVQLLQQLLATGRLKISAHCFYTIRMLKELKKGKDRLNFVLQSDENKHIFDALTYALIEECAEEMETLSRSYSDRRGGLAVCIT